MPEKWEEIVADKRSRLEKTIPAEWKIQTLPTEDSVIDYPTKSGLLSAKELEITNSTARPSI
jgi:amidase